MGSRGVVAALGVALLGGMTAGCAQDTSAAEARLAEVKAQGEEFALVLDDVEERLLGNQASVKLWNELAWRHRRVSAIACENLSTHAAQIDRFIAKEQGKARKVRRGRVAAAQEVSTAPVKGRKARQN